MPQKNGKENAKTMVLLHLINKQLGPEDITSPVARTSVLA